MTFPAGGGSATRTVSLSLANGFSKTVTLSATGLPAGATASFNPPTISGAATSILTVTTPAGLAAATYNVNVVGTVIDTAGGNPTRSTPLVLIVYTSGALPAGWSTADVGSVGITGTAGFAGTAFTVQGSGANIWGTADSFRFAYQSLTGDGTIVARVSGLQNLFPDTTIRRRGASSARILSAPPKCSEEYPVFSRRGLACMYTGMTTPF